MIFNSACKKLICLNIHRPAPFRVFKSSARVKLSMYSIVKSEGIFALTNLRRAYEPPREIEPRQRGPVALPRWKLVPRAAVPSQKKAASSGRTSRRAGEISSRSRPRARSHENFYAPTTRVRRRRPRNPNEPPNHAHASPVICIIKKREHCRVNFLIARPRTRPAA